MGIFADEKKERERKEEEEGRQKSLKETESALVARNISAQLNSDYPEQMGKLEHTVERNVITLRNGNGETLRIVCEDRSTFSVTDQKGTVRSSERGMAQRVNEWLGV